MAAAKTSKVKTKAKAAPKTKTTPKPKPKTKAPSTGASLKKSDRIVERMANTGDHLAILHLDHYDTYLEIDGIALEFWTLIDNKKTLADILATLHKRYPSERKELTKRTALWAQTLKKHRLLA